MSPSPDRDYRLTRGRRVANARTAGIVTRRHRRQEQRMLVRGADAAEAGPVLARYVELALTTRREFAAAPGVLAEAFANEAGRHPVFALSPVEG